MYRERRAVTSMQAKYEIIETSHDVIFEISLFFPHLRDPSPPMYLGLQKKSGGSVGRFFFFFWIKFLTQKKCSVIHMCAFLVMESPELV